MPCSPFVSRVAAYADFTEPQRLMQGPASGIGQRDAGICRSDALPDQYLHHVVDVGARSLAAACVMPVSEGMVVKTNTPQVRKARKAVLELILSNHERKCLSCVRSQNCELQDLAKAGTDY